MDERQSASVVYILEDTETGDETSYRKVMKAREEGEQRAQAAGLTVEGWRQIRPDCWFLMPDGRFSIAVRAMAR